MAQTYQQDDGITWGGILKGVGAVALGAAAIGLLVFNADGVEGILDKTSEVGGKALSASTDFLKDVTKITANTVGDLAQNVAETSGMPDASNLDFKTPEATQKLAEHLFEKTASATGEVADTAKEALKEAGELAGKTQDEVVEWYKNNAPAIKQSLSEITEGSKGILSDAAGWVHDHPGTAIGGTAAVVGTTWAAKILSERSNANNQRALS